MPKDPKQPWKTKLLDESLHKTHNFDAKRTPSEMGLLTELFRRAPGAKRSLHPTHSVTALGPLAEQLTATHHQATTPSGRGTPLKLWPSERQ
ncbi:MAG: AAC(3) family N-acetyltransferase [Rhodobacteraceae bacterium]|nr:AAC(3) family N-acetyltransferase [Paracoccaceae bacterium]